MILAHLHTEYTRTRFPFFSLVELKTKFGVQSHNELNQLFKDGLICKREGINSVLVQLLVDHDGVFIES